MPSVIRCQATFEANNLTARDAYTNRWHFLLTDDPPDIPSTDDVLSELITFYQSIAAWFSTRLMTGNVTYKFYDLSDPTPRVPYRQETDAMASMTSGDPLPSEVSCVLSFEAQPISGQPQSRRRNRVYLPPFLKTRLDPLGGWLAATYEGVATSGNALLTASNASPDWTWVARSETSGTVDAVARGWCDEAPDIQRRRGRIYPGKDIFP